MVGLRQNRIRLRLILYCSRAKTGGFKPYAKYGALLKWNSKSIEQKLGIWQVKLKSTSQRMIDFTKA
jgi:hypothetical protein